MSSQLFQGPAPRLWLRIEQDSDKSFYARIPPDTADGFIVNANLVEHSAGSLSAFLDKLERPFLVDPMCYRFDVPAWHTREKDGEIANKRNYARVWQRYSRDVDGLTGDAMRDRGHLSQLREGAILKFCANVLDFEDRRMGTEWMDDGAQYVSMDRLLGFDLAPAAQIAPYVVVGGEDPGREISCLATLCAASATIARPPIFAVLAIQPEVLGDVSLMRRLAREIAASRVHGAFLWPVNVSAYQLAESPALFTGLVVLVGGLHDAGLEVGFLYGGFYSTLLRSFGLTAFSHGLMYGEARGVEPAGGRPPMRFYLPALHDFYPYAIAEPMVAGLSNDQYLSSVCACDVCRALASSGALGSYFQTYVPERSKRSFPTPEALDLNRFHFLLARRQELEFVRSRPEPQLWVDLLDAADRFPPNAARLLRAWAQRLHVA